MLEKYLPNLRETIIPLDLEGKKNINTNIKQRPGGVLGCISRLVIQYIYIESLLRSGSIKNKKNKNNFSGNDKEIIPNEWKIAQLVLSERLCWAPSDAQAHWRLAALEEALGSMERAEIYKSKAQDFGIGQGGFKKYSSYPL